MRVTLISSTRSEADPPKGNPWWQEENNYDLYPPYYFSKFTELQEAKEFLKNRWLEWRDTFSLRIWNKVIKEFFLQQFILGSKMGKELYSIPLFISDIYKVEIDKFVAFCIRICITKLQPNLHTVKLLDLLLRKFVLYNF